jgi:hypothetical protein
MDIDKIKSAFREERVYYTRHAKTEMENEEFGRVNDAEVGQTIENGRIIEEYPTDKPYPSYLVFGRTSKKRPIHAVCAWNQKEELVIVVTVYEPDPARWIAFEKRR